MQERAAPRPWSPVPGPVDRVSFFEEQQRHRRSTWRLTALCGAAVLGMGLVVSCIVTPLLIGELSLVTEVFGIFLPPLRSVHQVLNLYFDLIQPALGGTDRPVSPLRMVLGTAGLFLPGIALMGLLWYWLRRNFLRAGVGGVLLTLGAREPRPNDLEEQQLVNVVAEMAIAAGLQPPRVMVLDSEVPNAAAIGSSPEDATVIVSHRLLDEFDRDQTQGVLGHLIGSIGNGDLRIAFTIVSMFQTLGLLMTLLDTPFSGEARRALWQVGRHALGAPGGDPAHEAEGIAVLLSQSLKSNRLDELGKFLEPDENSRLGRLDRVTVVGRGIRAMLFMPLLFANLFSKIVLFVAVPLVVGPLIALVWRSRRYLADATAVQLTRYPDGLSDALIELIEKGGLPPGGQWASHLFVVGTEVAGARARHAFQQDIERIRRERAAGVGPAGVSERAQRIISAARSAEQTSSAATAGTFAEENSIFVNFHPPLEKRLQRLRAQGALGDATPR